MSKSKPCVLTIAGSDSSGGAGIQADIKAISATGSYAASVITALTAQNTQGVQAIHAIPASFITQQLLSVLKDVPIQAIKIGMLNQVGVIEAIANVLKQYPKPFVVLDPVMVAKGGCKLMAENIIPILQTSLLPHVDLITPNTQEAEILLNQPIHNAEEQLSAAKNLAHQYKINVLVKGGHLKGEHAADVLYLQEAQHALWFSAERITSKNTHGTGCTLSSAIASYFAQTQDLAQAIQLAKHYLTCTIKAGQSLKAGAGHGPVEHFYFI